MNRTSIFDIKRLKLLPVKDLNLLTIVQQMNKASIFDKKKAETFTCKGFELLNYCPTDE